MKELLHVGCGPKTIKHLPGFFRTGWRESRLDIDPGVSPDILASLTDLSGIESDRFDGLWSSHNIEHVFPHEAAGVCQDFRRVLRPDGFAVITCPDIRVPLQAALKDGLDAAICQSGMGPISARDILFGHQASVAAGNSFMAHRNGFDLASLRDVLQQAGFRRIVGKRVGRTCGSLPVASIATRQPGPGWKISLPRQNSACRRRQTNAQRHVGSADIRAGRGCHPDLAGQLADPPP